MIEDKFKCRVCGLSQYPDLPWGEDGRQPSFNICPCCGVEFGYEDDGLQSCIEFRRRWIEIEHCRWLSPKDRPGDWDMATQIRGLPAVYRSDPTLILTYVKPSEPLGGLTSLDAIEKSSR